MDGLREIPGREALTLRAEASRTLSSYMLYFFSKCFCTFIFSYIMINYHNELSPSLQTNQVASMTSHLKRQRTALHKRIMKISDLGVPV